MKRPKKKTRFVPRAIYRTAFASVVPLCVAACGGAATTGNPADSGSDGNDDVVNLGGVGCAAFACGVANIGFDSGLSVAQIGFDAGSDRDARAADGPTEGSSSDGAPDSPALTVACLGFCGVGVSAFGDGGDSG